MIKIPYLLREKDTDLQKTCIVNLVFIVINKICTQGAMTVKFSEVSQAFAIIEPIQSRLEMTRMLAELLRQASATEASIICNLSLGQLQPPYIGTQFNIAEKTVIKAVAELLNLDPKDVEHRAKELGDLGSVVAEGTWHTTEDLTIHQVFTRLETIEQIGGTGSQEQKVSQLRQLLHDLDKISAKYLLTNYCRTVAPWFF